MQAQKKTAATGRGVLPVGGLPKAVFVNAAGRVRSRFASSFDVEIT